MKRHLLIIFFLVFSFSLRAQSGYYSDLNQKYTSGFFRSDNAFLFVPMDDVAVGSYLNVFQYIQARVPGLYVYQNAFNSPVIRYRYGYPALFLNEIRVSPDVLASININDVALIKVFRPPFFGALGGGPNGAIAVYTKKGDEEA